MADQRLPAINGDDGQWGDILNQFLEKEHFNTGANDPDNGSHKTINLQPGTIAASTAPLNFTSGPLMTTPEVGSVEFFTDAFYGTISTGIARKTFAFLESPTFTGTVTSPISILPIIKPATNSTTAIKFNKADGTTNVVSIDTTNGRLGIGVTPAEALDVYGNLRIGDTGTSSTGTIRAEKELVLRQDGDTYGPSILRLRNRNAENGAIFETTDPSITLVDFIFKTSANQRNIRYEARGAMARAGAPSFHIGGSSPDNPTLAIGDSYAAVENKLAIGSYTLPTAQLNISAGTTSAGTAPIKLVSGQLMTSPEIGAIEFLDDKLFITQTTNSTRKTIASYDDDSGATGDIYYRDAGSNFTRLPIGSSSDILQVTDGLPSWGGSGSYQLTSEKGQPSGYASLDANGFVVQNGKYHNHNAGIEGEPLITVGTGADAGKVKVASEHVWFADDSSLDHFTEHIITESSFLDFTDDLPNGNIIAADRDTDSWVVHDSYDLCDYLRFVPYVKVVKRSGSTSLHTQTIQLMAHGEIEAVHQRSLRTEPLKREPEALLGLSCTDTTLAITLGGGGVWSNSHRYILDPVTAATRQFECSINSSVWSYPSHTAPVLNTNYYNDPNSGLVTIDTGKYGIVNIFRGIEDEDHLYTILGEQQFDSLELAQASSRLANIAPLVSSHALFVGRICFKKGALTGVDWACESAFDTTVTASGITVHNYLSGRDTEGSHPGSAITVSTIGSPTMVLDHDDFIRYGWSAGTVSGGDLTDNHNGTIDIAAGEALLRESASNLATLYSVTFPANSGIPLTNNSTNYIYVDYNSGSPIISQTTNSSDYNCWDKCHLYTIFREGNQLAVLDGKQQNIDSNRNARKKSYETEDFKHVKGGSVLGNSGLYITVSSGAFYYAFNKITHPAFDTSVAGVATVNTLESYSSTSTPGVWNHTTQVKQINTGVYDDGNGNLVALSASYYSTYWLYLILDSIAPRLVCVYGKGNYASLIQARAESVPTTLPLVLSTAGVLIGKVCFVKDATSYDVAESAFSATFSATGNSQWGNIGGNIASQPDLQTALAAKASKVSITGATKTKITYNTDGIVTAGADATTADIADSTNKRYVTDVQLAGINPDLSGYQLISGKNQNNGYAGLDANGLLTPSQLLDWSYARQSSIDRVSSGLGGNSRVSSLISTHAGGTALDVGAGFGYINDQSGTAGTFKRIDFAGGSNIGLAGNGLNYVHINSSGSVIISLTKLSSSTNIYLGHVYVVGGSVVGTPRNVPEWAGNYQGKVNEFMSDAMKTIVASGLSVSEQATLLKLSIAAGEMYTRLSAIDVASPVTTFVKMYNNNGTWTVDSSTANYVNTSQWNNTASGLVTMTTGYWKKDLVLITPAKDVYYIFGQAEYATVDLAKAGAMPVISPELQLDSAYLSLIVSQKGDTTIASRLLNITPSLSRVFGYGTEGGGVVVDYNSLLNKPTIPVIPTYSTYSLATGVISRGVISINVDTTKIDITAGSSLYVDDSDPLSPIVDVLTWGNLTAQTPPNLATDGRLWVGVSRTSVGVGTIVYSSEFTASEKRTIAILGRVWGNGTSVVTGVGQYATPAFGYGKTIEDLIWALGSLNINGNIFSAYGTGLTLSKTSGSSFRFSAASGIDLKSPNIVSDTSQTNISAYNYHISQSSSGFTTLQTTIDPNYYDNAGTKTLVTSGYFSIQRVYYFPRSGVIDVCYGQAQYATLADAVSGLATESYVITDANTRTLFGSILRSSVIVKQGATNLSDSAQAKILTSTNGSGGATSGGNQVNADWNAVSGDAFILNKPTIPAAATDANIAITDITTNNVSTTQHGLFPKLPAPTGKYLKDDMTWVTPPAGGLSQQQVMAINSMRI